MKVGLVGSGAVGQGVAKLAAQAGCAVVVSNSRGPDTLVDLARHLGAVPGTVGEAAAFADLVVLAVPFSVRTSLPAELLTGRILLDAMNYYPHRDGGIAELDQGRTTTSSMIAALLPGARVVKAFNAILAADLVAGGRLANTELPRAVPIAADAADSEAKRLAAHFVERLGFAAVDAGDLEESWRFERGKPAYCVPHDRAGLRAALAAARRDDDLPVPKSAATPRA